MCMDKKTVRAAFQASLPVMAGYIVLGMGFGVLLADQGYHWIWALLMSATIYAGSMQYAALDLISGGASLITCALMTLMINARHFFYGLSMLDKYQAAGKKKPYLVFALTDETYSLVCTPAPEGTDATSYYFWVSLLDQIYWIVGSVIGGVLGPILPFDSTGIPALLGLGISLGCLLLLGPTNFVIPSMVLITAALCACRRVLEVRPK